MSLLVFFFLGYETICYDFFFYMFDTPGGGCELVQRLGDMTLEIRFCSPYPQIQHFFFYGSGTKSLLLVIIFLFAVERSEKQ